MGDSSHGRVILLGLSRWAEAGDSNGLDHFFSGSDSAKGDSVADVFRLCVRSWSALVVNIALGTDPDGRFELDSIPEGLATVCRFIDLLSKLR